MQIAIYVVYELLIRLQELNPAVGEYISNKKTIDGILVRTSNGTVEIPDTILHAQFNDPSSISQGKISNILDSFTLTFPTTSD